MTKNHIILGVAIAALLLVGVAFAINSSNGKAASTCKTALCDKCPKATASKTEATCCCGDACACCDGCKTGNCTCEDCKCCDCCKAKGCCCGDSCACCDGCKTGNCTCEDCKCCGCCKK